jgi:hypothetical protein
VWLKALGPATAFEAGLYELLQRAAQTRCSLRSAEAQMSGPTPRGLSSRMPSHLGLVAFLVRPPSRVTVIDHTRPAKAFWLANGVIGPSANE